MCELLSLTWSGWGVNIHPCGTASSEPLPSQKPALPERRPLYLASSSSSSSVHIASSREIERETSTRSLFLTVEKTLFRLDEPHLPTPLFGMNINIRFFADKPLYIYIYRRGPNVV